MRLFQFCLLFFLVCCTLGANLTCYTCDNCPEPFDPSKAGTETQPVGENYYCSKFWTGVYVKREMERDCTPFNVGGSGKWCCRTNYCNDASSMVFHSLMWMPIIVAGILYRLKD